MSSDEQKAGTEYFKSFSGCKWGKEIEEKLKLIKSVTTQYGGKAVDVLSIGPADGNLDDLVMKNTGLNLSSYHGIEPIGEYVSKLRETVSSWNKPHVVEQRYFTPSFQMEKSFDLVLMFSCLYYVKDVGATVLKAKSLLKPGGKVLIIVQTDASGLQKFAVQPTLLDGQEEVYQVGDHKLNHKVTMAQLDKVGVKYDVTVCEKYFYDADDYIKNRTPNSTVNFLLLRNAEDYPESVQNEIYDAVKERSVKGEDGKYYGTTAVALIVVNA